MNKTLNLSIALLLSTNATAMTQVEFVDRLKNTHPFFTQQGLEKQSSQLDYVASTANQDWVLGGSIDSDNKLNKQISSGSITATHKLVDTGADVSISKSWSDISSKTSVLTSDKFLVNYTLPLLKNVNGDYIVIFSSGSTNTLMPVWINAGTELKASFYSTSSNFQWTWQAWLPYVSHVNLSIIEFYVVPIE